MTNAEFDKENTWKLQEILSYFDTQVNYKSKEEKDHVIAARTWNSYKDKYNDTHPNSPITNQSRKKTSGARYRKDDVQRVFEYINKDETIKKLAIKKEKTRLEKANLTDALYNLLEKQKQLEKDSLATKIIYEYEDLKLEIFGMFNMKKILVDLLDEKKINRDNLYQYLKKDVLEVIKSDGRKKKA